MMTDDELEAIRARADGGIEYRGSADALAAIHDRRDLLIEVDRLRAVVAGTNARSLTADEVERMRDDPYRLWRDAASSSPGPYTNLDAAKRDAFESVKSLAASIRVGSQATPKPSTPARTVTVRLDGGPWDGQTREVSRDAIGLGFQFLADQPTPVYRQTGRMGDDNLPIWACDPAEPSGETWRDRKPLL